jgi:hypothetical protein
MTEHQQGDALSQELVRRRPELAGQVHYINGEPWCDGIHHTTMCGDEAPAVPSPPVAAALDREALGRIVHETRLAENTKRDRPFRLEPWDRRAPSQQELDMKIAEAVAAAERERIAARMDALAANYPEDIFPPDSDVRDAIGGTAMRHAYRNAAREIREPDRG